MFGSFGWMELLLILIIVLIIFGAGKLPQLGEGLGKAIKGFKKSVHEADAIDVTPDEQSQQAQSQAASSNNQVNTQSEPTPSPAPHATPSGQVKHG
ncbi:MAG TPA: twin-arginine translocase TatA/TatE family subunit [Nitrospira sp.]|nr:twin-arginine translocase TatA/TatE family subunit [Nitrospira sp.]